jgi:hypothetical protein
MAARIREGACNANVSPLPWLDCRASSVDLLDFPSKMNPAAVVAKPMSKVSPRPSVANKRIKVANSNISQVRRMVLSMENGFKITSPSA